MDQQIKAKWLEALRSGKYQQTSDNLRNEEGFCCLGVLCDISGLADWVPSVLEPGTYAYFSAGLVLPVEVQEWAGLTLTNPDVVQEIDEEGEEHWNTLTELNDDGYRFAEIADFIEASL